MARRFFRRYTPHPDRIREHNVLRMFGHALHRPNLWHLNRASVSRAFAVGLFWALIPMPFQMVMAAFFAIKFRANLALSCAMVWLSNPLTMAPLLYIQYVTGRTLLRVQPLPGEDSLFNQLTNWRNWIDWHWITHTLAMTGKPLYAGAIVTGLFASLASYVLIQIFWRWNIRRKWNKRGEDRDDAEVITVANSAPDPLKKSA